MKAVNKAGSARANPAHSTKHATMKYLDKIAALISSLPILAMSIVLVIATAHPGVLSSGFVEIALIGSACAIVPFAAAGAATHYISQQQQAPIFSVSPKQ